MGVEDHYPFLDEDVGEDAGLEFDDYYELLDVSESASTSEINKAFREMVKKHHPDRNDRPDAQICFEQITAAKNVLTDPDERELYDDLGHRGYKRKKREEADTIAGGNTEAEWAPETHREGGSDSSTSSGSSASTSTQAQSTGTAGQSSGQATSTQSGSTSSVTERSTGAYVDADSGASEDEDRDGVDQVYHWVSNFRETSASSESITTVRRLWGSSWRYRIALAMLFTMLGVFQVTGRALVDVPGLPQSVRDLFIAGNVFLASMATVFVVMALTGYNGELRLPRNGFVDDTSNSKDHLFAREKARKFRRRGAIFLGIAVFFTLLGSTPGTGSDMHPWVFAHQLFFGNTGGVTNPWIAPATFNAPQLLPLLRIGCTLMLVFSIIFGTVYATVGLSIDTWYDRHIRGFPVHPALWEPWMVFGLVGFLWVFAFPVQPIDWLHLPWAPAAVQNAFAFYEGKMTFVSVGVLGLIAAFLVPRLYFLRTYVALRFGDFTKHTDGE